MFALAIFLPSPPPTNLLERQALGSSFFPLRPRTTFPSALKNIVCLVFECRPTFCRSPLEASDFTCAQALVPPPGLFTPLVAVSCLFADRFRPTVGPIPPMMVTFPFPPFLLRHALRLAHSPATPLGSAFLFFLLPPLI